MRILLIDDDPDVRLLAGYALAREGHEVVFAETGTAGITAAASGGFDVILLDYRLGDMTGGHVMAQLGRFGERPPVVFLTGVDDAGAERLLVDLGAAGVITKPFDPEQLSSLIARRLGEAQVRPGLDPATVERLRRIGGAALVVEMIDSVFGHAEKRMAEVRAAVRRNDAHAISEQAHGLKSSAANVGALALRRVAERVEKEAAAPGADLRRLSEALHTALDAARVAAAATREAESAQQ